MDVLYVGALALCSVVMWAFIAACNKLEERQ